jgi:hypothetical protein
MSTRPLHFPYSCLSNLAERLHAHKSYFREDGICGTSRGVWQEQSDEGQPRLGPPIAWAIGLAAIMSVFAVVVIVANYVPLNRESERRIDAALTPATYATISALIEATGNRCAKICSISSVVSLTGVTQLDVACDSDIGSECRVPIHYRVNIEAAAGSHR